jgi:hypothetical protein
MTLRSVLLSIQNLLYNPEPRDPLNPHVAIQYGRNEQMFRVTFYFADSLVHDDDVTRFPGVGGGQRRN